jgi:hypothetical protein
MQTATISQQAAPARPWYRHRWPWLLMLGPAAAVCAGAYTIVLAFSRPDALVVDDYYKQGKAINQDLRRDRNAARLGMKATLGYDAATGMLNGRLGDRGAPVAGRIDIRLVHSTLPGKDIRLLAQADAQGRFAVALPMLDIARWQVLVENEGRDWRLNGTWQWPQQKNIELDAGAPADG